MPSRPQMIEPLTLSDALFCKYQQLVENAAGIYLSDAKKALVIARLSKRMRHLGIESLEDYFHMVSNDKSRQEIVALLNCISTNETHFFREPQHFEFLAQEIIPQWKREGTGGKGNRHIRVWSVGCSTGEEPYSLGMVLLSHFPPSEGWEVEILATDINTEVLQQASSALYPMEKVQEIPLPYIKEYMMRGIRSKEGLITVSPLLRKIIQFGRFTLVAPDRVQGRFNLIFCRNTLIYFRQNTKQNIVKGLFQYLAPKGYFFVGHAESLNGVMPGVKSVCPSIYRVDTQA